MCHSPEHASRDLAYQVTCRKPNSSESQREMCNCLLLFLLVCAPSTAICTSGISRYIFIAASQLVTTPCSSFGFQSNPLPSS